MTDHVINKSQGPNLRKPIPLANQSVFICLDGSGRNLKITNKKKFIE